jgi:hypothetical protein
MVLRAVGVGLVLIASSGCIPQRPTTMPAEPAVIAVAPVSKLPARPMVESFDGPTMSREGEATEEVADEPTVAEGPSEDDEPDP